MIALVGEKINLKHIETLVGKFVNINGDYYQVNEIDIYDDEIIIYTWIAGVLTISLVNNVVSEIDFFKNTDSLNDEIISLTSF
jgi:hypothetical protein